MVAILTHVSHSVLLNRTLLSFLWLQFSVTKQYLNQISGIQNNIKIQKYVFKETALVIV